MKRERREVKVRLIPSLRVSTRGRVILLPESRKVGEHHYESAKVTCRLTAFPATANFKLTRHQYPISSIQHPISFHGTLFQPETVSRGTRIFVKTSVMARKRWEAKTEITPELLKSREKRKWQINLRRYVIERSPCPFYAPYFGLDIENIRKWFEYQFSDGLNWDNFAKTWQFDHIIPVTYFDHSKDTELRLCWNFTNLRVEPFQLNKNRGNRLDVLGAKAYFEELYNKTGYPVAKSLQDKILTIEISEFISSEPQQKFLADKKGYLVQIENYSEFEFELLNRGRSVEEVNKEIDFLKKNIQP